MFDWSHDLLARKDRRLLRRLAVFAGSFNLEAVEAICADDEGPERPPQALAAAEVLDLLTHLVNKSWVMPERQPGKEARYYLLETIRDYAQEKLEAAGEVEQLRLRHLNHYLQLAEAAEQSLRTAAEVEWFDQLEADHTNLLAALHWSLNEEGEILADGLRLFAALGEFWVIRSQATAGQHLMPQSLQKAGRAPPLLRARVLMKAGHLIRERGDPAASLPLFKESVALFRESDEKRGLARVLRKLGLAYTYLSHFALALPLLEESLALAQALDERVLVASVYSLMTYSVFRLGDLSRASALCEEGLLLARAAGSERDVMLLLQYAGLMAMARGDFARATAQANDSLIIARRLKDVPNIVKQLLTRGDLAFTQQKHEEAAVLYEESLLLARELANNMFLSTALHRVARIRLHQGKRDEALPYLHESLQLAYDTGQPEQKIACLIAFADVAVEGGNPQRAARLLGAVATQQDVIASPLYPFSQFFYDRSLSMIRDQLDQATLTAAWEAGRVMSPEQTMAYALEMEAETVEQAEVQPPALLIHAAEELRLLALGPAQVYRGERLLTPADWTFAKPKELLFYLLYHGPRTKEQIGLIFWPDATPGQLRSSLRAALYHMRRALGSADWIVFAGGRYDFNRSRPHQVDVDAFTTHLEQARQQPEKAVPHLEAAIRLYRGELLEDVAVDSWCRPRREALRQQYLEALLQLGRLNFNAGHYGMALEIYGRAIAADNLLEAAHRGMMRCYARLGERGQALRHYRSLVQLLATELEAAPEAETAALYEQLYRGTE